MRARFLGATEVALDGGDYRPVRGPRIQQLLCVYALHAGHAVSNERVVDALWREDVPANPWPTLRRYVARLRDVVGGDGVLIKALDGYLLLLDPADVDVAMFEHGVTAGRAAMRTGDHSTALRHLQRSRDLWRGDPWTALAGWPPAEGEIVRGRELLASLEELIVECRMRLGRFADASEELAALCERAPRRERRWELLMIALALSGRQADALAAYQRAHRRMVDEVGVEPSRHLREVESDILQDRIAASWGTGAGPAPAPPIRPAAPRAPVVLVGRDDQARVLDDQLHQTMAGELRAASVSGEAGMGKTVVLRAFVHRAAAAGAAAHWGECYEAEATGAYRPVVTLLRSVLNTLGPQGTVALDQEADELAVLLPELSSAQPDALGPATSIAPDAPGRRELRLFDAVTRLLRAAALDRPSVLILDDAHWSDAPSLALLGHALRHLGDVAALVVLAYRPEEVHPTHPLRALLAEMRAGLRPAEVVLDALPPEELAVLADATSRVTLPRPLVDAVTTASGGNPMFVVELARTLADGGGPGDAGDVDWSVERVARQLPARIVDVVSRRIRLVSPVARETLAVVAACPGGCDTTTLGRALALGPSEVVEAVEELLDVGLLAEATDGPDASYAVAHALHAHVAFQSASRARQVNVHFQLALALDEAVDRDRDRYLAEAGYHWHAAGRSGDPARAAQRCEEAGDLAYERTAFSDALAHYGRAIDAVRWSGDGHASLARLLTKRAQAHDGTGDSAGRERDAEAACQVADEIGDAASFGRAALVHGGFRSTYGAANPVTTDLLARAHHALPSEDTALRALVNARLAQELHHAGDHEAARRLSREGVELAQLVGDDDVLAAAYQGLVWTLNHPDWLDERLSLSDEMVARAVRSRNPGWEMTGRVWRAAALLERGDMVAVEAEVVVLARLADVVAVPSQRVRVATFRATLAMMRGEFDRGIELAQEAHAIGRVNEPANADQVLYAQMIAPLRERGQLASLVPMIEALAELYADAPGWRCAAAFALCAAGEQDRGWALIERLAEGGFRDVPRDLAWMQGVAYAAEAVAMVGAGDAAPPLYELMVPYDGRNVGLWDIASGGAVAHYLGILAACQGQTSRALAHLDAAVAFNDRTGQLPAALRSRLERARLRAAAGEDALAAADAAEVAAAAESHDYLVLAKAARLLRANQ